MIIAVIIHVTAVTVTPRKNEGNSGYEKKNCFHN